jgi:hypothetical protein
MCLLFLSSLFFLGGWWTRLLPVKKKNDVSPRRVVTRGGNMDWLRGKKRGGAEVTLARPGSKGSARDPLDVAVEGMGEDAASVPQKTGDEVDIWQEIPEMGVGSTQPAIFAVEEEDTSSDGFAKAGMSKNISRTAMAGNLFDTIDKSGDGNVSKDELTAILEVLLLHIFAAKLLLIIKLLR